jgi:hypothetical protein
MIAQTVHTPTEHMVVAGVHALWQANHSLFKLQTEQGDGPLRPEKSVEEIK